MNGLEISCRQLGDYLQEVDDGRHLILRGKYRGCFLNAVPRGYIRKFILVKWLDGMTDEERELFEQFGRKDLVTEWVEDEVSANDAEAKKEVDASSSDA